MSRWDLSEAENLLREEEKRAFCSGWDGRLVSMPPDVRAAKQLFEEVFLKNSSEK